MRAVYLIVGILVLALMATGLTEASLAWGRRPLGNDQAARPAATPKPSPSVTPSPTATPAPSATVNRAATMRATASVTGVVLFRLTPNTVVTLRGAAAGSWQFVEYSGHTGYIHKDSLNY
jgi:hypothetical protein